MENIVARITADPIDAGAFVAAFPEPAHGAAVFFFGVVRNENHRRSVTAVSYDAHPRLAQRELERIAGELVATVGPSVKIRVTHRTGRLAVGEASVAIGVSTPHRAEAFAAARAVIEEIKKRLPVWKREHYADGESEWLRGHALCGHHGREATSSAPSATPGSSAR
jgi:molybdopterin synthase catalytic subunit